MMPSTCPLDVEHAALFPMAKHDDAIAITSTYHHHILYLEPEISHPPPRCCELEARRRSGCRQLRLQGYMHWVPGRTRSDVCEREEISNSVPSLAPHNGVAGDRWTVPTGQGGLEWRVGPKIKVQYTHRTTCAQHHLYGNPSTTGLDEWEGHGKEMNSTVQKRNLF